MRISAKADYALRAVIELRRAGIVQTHRGPAGGSSLARAADSITVAEILRVIDGPLAAVRDLPPEQLVYEGAARNLPAVWCRLHACLRDLLDGITVAELVAEDFDRAHSYDEACTRM